MNCDQLVSAYLSLKQQKAQLDDAAKEVARRMKDIEATMLDELGAAHVESLRTASGTFSRKIAVLPRALDWDAFYSWIRANDAFDFLHKRISAAAVATYMDEHDGEPPAGLAVERAYTVSVRSPLREIARLEA